MNNYLILFAHATIIALVQRYRILSACDAFPYTIKFECEAGECAAYLQSVEPFTKAVITPHAQRERGKVIGVWCPYLCLYVCGPKKYLYRSLAIDSPFQTYAVGLLVEFID